MFAKISYNAAPGNDASGVLADLTALLTGETLVANLTGVGSTGSVDAATSQIDTTYTTVAYTLFDDVSTTQKVFQIPVHDDATKFFYLELFVYNSNEIHFKMWETWETVGHTGTGQGYYHYQSNQIVSVNGYATTPHIMYITATPRHLIINRGYYFRGFIQYNRAEAWDTVTAGFIPVLFTNGDYFATSTVYTLSQKRSDNVVYNGTNAVLYLATRYGNNQNTYDDFNQTLGGNSSAARGLDANGNSVHNMYELGASYISSGPRFMTGKFLDMYLATYQNGASGDTILIGGNTYRIWEIDANYRMAIRQG